MAHSRLSAGVSRDGDLVFTVIAAVGGWSALARLYREPQGMRRRPARSFFLASVDLRGGLIPFPTQYRHCVRVDVAPDGLHLRAVFPFRLSHPPLLIPWERIERYDAGRFLFWRTLTVQPHGTSIRIRLWGAAARGVEEEARQIAAGAARSDALEGVGLSTPYPGRDLPSSRSGSPATRERP